jgi:hypothetical protein
MVGSGFPNIYPFDTVRECGDLPAANLVWQAHLGVNSDNCCSFFASRTRGLKSTGIFSFGQALLNLYSKSCGLHRAIFRCCDLDHDTRCKAANLIRHFRIRFDSDHIFKVTCETSSRSPCSCSEIQRETTTIPRNMSEDKFEHLSGVFGTVAVVRLGGGAESGLESHQLKGHGLRALAPS